MSASFHTPITDELLSAYLDNALTAEEKMLVDAALQNEPTVAWRLESLRQTINLLHSLPTVSLPRSFALTELQVAEQTQPPVRTSSPQRAKAEPTPTGLARLWETWRSFWQVGTPWLRNAAAVSFALFLILIAGDYALPTLPAGNPPRTSSVRQAAPASAEVAVQTSEVADQASPVANNAGVAQPTTIAMASTPSSAEAAERESEPAIAAAAAEVASKESTAPAQENASANAAAPLPQLPPASSGAGGELGLGDNSISAVPAPSMPDVGRAPGPDQGSGYYQEPESDQPLIAESLSAILAATEPVTIAADAVITETDALSETTSFSETLPLSETSVITAGVTLSTVAPLAEDMAAPSADADPEATSQAENPEQAAIAWPRFQLATAGLTLIFGLLWWRSRSSVVVKSE